MKEVKKNNWNKLMQKINKNGQKSEKPLKQIKILKISPYLIIPVKIFVIAVNLEKIFARKSNILKQNVFLIAYTFKVISKRTQLLLLLKKNLYKLSVIYKKVKFNVLAHPPYFFTGEKI